MKREIHGNIGGIRDIVLNEMMLLYDMEMSADEFLSDDVCDALVRITSIINREVLIYVSRVGKIEDVRVGDDHSVHMEEMRLVRNIDRLSGVRCIHTHPNETGYLSDVDLGSLNALRLDAMCAIGVKDGRASSVYAAFIGDMEGEERIPVWYGPMRAHHLPQKQPCNDDEHRPCDAQNQQTLGVCRHNLFGVQSDKLRTPKGKQPASTAPQHAHNADKGQRLQRKQRQRKRLRRQTLCLRAVIDRKILNTLSAQQSACLLRPKDGRRPIGCRYSQAVWRVLGSVSLKTGTRGGHIGGGEDDFKSGRML